MPGIARAIAVAALGAMLTGCPAIPIAYHLSKENAGKETFEKNWNSTIGRYRDIPRDYQEALVETRTATEYVIRQKQECQIGLLVNNSDSTIIAWRYVSEPKKCWE